LNEQYEPATQGLEVGSWFHHDWLPLNETEIQHGLCVVRWAHQDLLELTAALSEAQLEQEHAGERWNIREILRHVADAEWWYLERLSLASCNKEDLPAETWERLNFTLEQYSKVLPALENQENVLGREGEFWSPRKIVRRACWHALDHCQHIHKLLTA
jgi:hypothetical protein